MRTFCCLSPTHTHDKSQHKVHTIMTETPSPSLRALQNLSIPNTPTHISLRRTSPNKSKNRRSPGKGRSRRVKLLGGGYTQDRTFHNKPSLTVVECCCSEHVNCRFVGKDEFKQMLKRVFECSQRYTDYMDNVIFFQWVEGRVIIKKMMSSSLWDEDECRYCFIEEFLSQSGRHAWLLSLKAMGEKNAFDRSIQFLKSTHIEVENIYEWIDEVLRCGNNETKQLELDLRSTNKEKIRLATCEPVQLCKIKIYIFIDPFSRLDYTSINSRLKPHIYCLFLPRFNSDFLFRVVDGKRSFTTLHGSYKFENSF